MEDSKRYFKKPVALRTAITNEIRARISRRPAKRIDFVRPMSRSRITKIYVFDGDNGTHYELINGDWALTRRVKIQ